MKNNLKKNNKDYLNKEINWQNLNFSISDSAIQQIKHLIKNNTEILGIRINIKKYGCAGLSFTMDKVIMFNNIDLIYKYDGVKLFISPEAILFINGTKLDYIKEGLNYSFKFHNSKAQYTCGCGESFNI
ncbi:iron-sulfur cluster assembly accessory protein [Blochmannia endosymbiont of Colobopsis nipponica]|uniref:iron-sulfur cluster assembly accessory protein n=1 Tax=Blochmannia endosymbiont of Colobopsis nipponica TaxID=2681987 RepID=UPI00177D8C33|nr:iron-sulfur cluster assembly accessory protein [Blochmannia endosymbiont of Colobopsis nipponica]QOI11087.1 iron-sulfur cluster assembly accessory protein [Blochmannia endosymbiont of Colobopsis nipponica]